MHMETLELLREMIFGCDNEELHNLYKTQLEKLARTELTDEKQLRFAYKMRVILLTEGRKHTNYKALETLYSNLIQVIQSTLDGQPPPREVWDHAFEAFDDAHKPTTDAKMQKAVKAQLKSYRTKQGIFDDLAGYILLALEQEIEPVKTQNVTWN